MKRLNVRKNNGTIHSVAVYREFEAFGERFFVHQNIGWRPFLDFEVSHVVTGMRVSFLDPVVSAGSPESAEEFGREYIEKVGETEVKATIARALREYGPANEVKSCEK
jgi:hypothetical protein